MQLTITINMDNAAFGDDADDRLVEARCILEGFCDEVYQEMSFNPGLDRVLMDSNGNSVGRALVKA